MGVLDTDLKRIAENFGKQLADSASKHFTASMSTQGKAYQPTEGRGGKGDRSPLTQGGGVIGSSQVLEQEVKALSKSFEDAKLKNKLKRLGEGLELLKPSNWKELGANVANKRLDAITSDAENAAAGLTGIHKQFADGLIKYVRADDTNIDNLYKNAELLSGLNQDLHNIGFDDEISAGSDSFSNLVDDLNDLTDATGESVDFFQAMPPHLQEAMDSIKRDGMSRSALADATEDQAAEQTASFNAQQEALGWITNELETTGDTIANIGVRMTKSSEDMLAANSARMMKLVKGGAAAASYGAFQYIEDTMYRYQASIGRSYNAAAMSMGMSHRQVQDAMLDYRDTLRTEAAMSGTDIYSDASVEAMKRIQDLGETFGMIKDEAFRFGMQMKETGRLTGMADLTEQEMLSFYGHSAKMMNMTVSEFGQHFNTMAKDPAFQAFVNNARLMGGSVQETVAKELSNRIRMNKILGLSNENLQARLNLENAKRWAPIVERYRSQIGSAQLVRMYEEELGMAFTQSQQDILSQYSFNPDTLTAAQKKVFNDEILPALMVAPEMMQEQLNTQIIEAKQAGDTQRAQALTQQAAVTTHLTSLFGEMAGKGVFDTEAALAANAAIKNMAAATDMTTAEIVTALKDGDVGVKSELATYIKGVTGELEDTIGKSDDPTVKGLGVINDTLSNIYGSLSEAVTGFAASGVGKATTGILGTAAGLGAEIWMHKRVMGVLGANAANATKTAGVLSKVATAASSFGGATISGTKALLLNNAGLLKGAGALGLMATAGYMFGDMVYNMVKDKAWFTDSVDATLDFLPNMWSKLTDSEAEAEDRKRLDWQKDNMNLTPKFEQLTREQQKQYNESKAQREKHTATIASNSANQTSSANKELKKVANALEAQNVLANEPTPADLVSQEILVQSKKTNELAEKRLVQAKDQGEQIVGGQAQANKIAAIAAKSSDGWQASFIAKSGDAAAQYTA